MSEDGKANILIVDDRPEKLLALEAVLEDLGENIVRAYSGREALRALLNQEFAVILLDVNMPSMDGFETASLIRQRKATEHVPIIFITAFGDETSTRGYQLGAVDYIQTPVVPDVLKTKVSVFVDLYRKTEQVQRQAEWQRRRASQLQRLAAASLAINSALSVEKMLQTVTDTARDLVGAHQAITLFVLDEPSGDRPARTQSFASFSDRYANWRSERLELDAIASTIVARSQAVTRMTEQELRDHPDWDIVRGVRIPPVRGGMLAAPLVSRTGSSIGVIYLSDRVDGNFTHEDEAILTQLAQMASIAIENSLFAEEREANRIKDEFLSTLSHELRTPLNAILGWTQLLKTEPLEGEVAHAVDVIDRNAKAQAKLVEDLLDVSRVSTGKLRLNTCPLDVWGVATSAVDAVRPTAEAKQINFALSCDADDARTIGDPDRLQQVVWNLLSNAVKFTPRGGRVEVRLDRAGQHLRLRVSDSGQGISPSFLPHVFDRFRQADASSTRTHGGLGIGLTIVRHIVEMHGGTVTAESPGDGQGSTFTVHLPVNVGAAVREPTGERFGADGNGSASGAEGRGGLQVAASENGQTPDLSNLSVVLVDDERDALEVIGEILRRAGAEVLAATNVQDALATIVSTKPDIVVSDIAMPEQDGYDLIRTLRQLPESGGGDRPVVALSAYAREEDRLRSIAAGFQAHLAKPVSPLELTATIARLCRERNPTDPVPQFK